MSDIGVKVIIRIKKQLEMIKTYRKELRETVQAGWKEGNVG